MDRVSSSRPIVSETRQTEDADHVSDTKTHGSRCQTFLAKWKP
jgi:hypothetical protein